MKPQRFVDLEQGEAGGGATYARFRSRRICLGLAIAAGVVCAVVVAVLVVMMRNNSTVAATAVVATPPADHPLLSEDEYIYIDPLLANSTDEVSTEVQIILSLNSPPWLGRKSTRQHMERILNDAEEWLPSESWKFSRSSMREMIQSRRTWSTSDSAAALDRINLANTTSGIDSETGAHTAALRFREVVWIGSGGYKGGVLGQTDLTLKSMSPKLEEVLAATVEIALGWNKTKIKTELNVDYGRISGDSALTPQEQWSRQARIQSTPSQNLTIDNFATIQDCISYFPAAVTAFGGSGVSLSTPLQLLESRTDWNYIVEYEVALHGIKSSLSVIFAYDSLAAAMKNSAQPKSVDAEMKMIPGFTVQGKATMQQIIRALVSAPV